MKHFVVLLVLSLTAAEKLNRRYLPPPGTKFAGGRSDDLQTPFEYPKETPAHSPSGYIKTIYTTDNTEKIGNPYERELYSMVRKGHNYKSLGSGIDNPTVNIDFSEENPLYAANGNMPIIAVPESLGRNYQPTLFGMYGGNPMIIKSFYNKIKKAGSDDLRASDEKVSFSEDDLVSEVRPPQNIRNPQTNQYLPITPGPNKGTIPTIGRDDQNLSFKKFKRPQENTDRSAVVFNYENFQNPNGYFYDFDTTNGIHVEESASTLDGVKAKGSYSYMGDNGKIYTVTYTADENGFQPSGDHLPLIPEAIQKVIEQTKKDKEAGIIDDGSYDENKYGHMKYQGPIYRYMQEHVKTHKRKKVSGNQKKIAKSKMINHKTNNVDKTGFDNLQPKRNKNRTPFETKSVQEFVNSRNEKDFIQSYKTTKNQDYSPDKSQKNNKNSIGSNNMVLQNFQRHRGNLNLNKEKHFEISAIQDGYFYVPPENVFIDGKYQGKPLTTNYLNTKSFPVSEFYINDQKNENVQVSDINIIKMNQFTSSTEESVGHQIYNGDFYVSTNADVDQLIDNARTTTKASSNNKIGTDATKQHYSSTNPFDNEFTKEIVEQENTIFPENNVETNFIPTTPVSSEIKYTTQETTSTEFAQTSSNFDVGYSENEGDFKTTPDKPTTFEDFPSSTYSPPIYTIDGTVNSDLTPNIKADKFGRPSQESYGYITESPVENLTNGIQINTDSKAIEQTLTPVKSTTLDYKSITQFQNEFESDVENSKPDDLPIEKASIIGEDFSGPKQPQGYNPESGYYY